MNVASFTAGCGVIVAIAPLIFLLATKLTGRGKERSEIASIDSKSAIDYKSLADQERTANANIRIAARKFLRFIDQHVAPVLHEHDPPLAEKLVIETDELDKLL